MVCPLHDESLRVQLWKEAKVIWPLSAPIDTLQSYYGEQVAIYFAWLDCLTMMLIGPSIFGVYVWLAREDEASIDTDPRTTMYSFFMVIWGFAFLQTWKRTANGCAWKWDTFDVDTVQEPNPQFHGFERINPVTGQPDLHYKSHKRWMTISLVSLPVTIAMLIIAFAIMSMSLNLQVCCATPTLCVKSHSFATSDVEVQLAIVRDLWNRVTWSRTLRFTCERFHITVNQAGSLIRTTHFWRFCRYASRVAQLPHSVQHIDR